MSAGDAPTLNRWAIVLAGGEGERLRPLVESWLGHARPKQYCRFVPPASMLERTLARAECLVPRERILTVVGREHDAYLEDQRTLGRLLVQPQDRGTLPGVLLPLAHILAEDPDSMTYLFPSVHHVEPDGRFLELVARAGDLAETVDEGLVLLGAIPDRPEEEYGWIEPGRWTSVSEGSVMVSRVRGFVDMPGRRQARRLFHRGSLWNSAVIAARSRALWNLARELVPGIVERFALFLDVVCAVNAGRAPDHDLSLAAAHVYGRMEAADIRRDLVQEVPDRATVVALEGVRWSAWGDPAQMARSLIATRSQAPVAPELARALQPWLLAESECFGRGLPTTMSA